MRVLEKSKKFWWLFLEKQFFEDFPENLENQKTNS